MDPVMTKRTEWRVVGEHPMRGHWHGGWRQQDPVATPNGRYEVKSYVKAGSEVWIECREVWESSVVRIEAAVALGDQHEATTAEPDQA